MARRRIAMKKLLSVSAALVAVLALGAPTAGSSTLQKRSACFAMIVSLDGSSWDRAC
jgi:hypothetical protein